MALIEPLHCVQQATQKEDVARRFSGAAGDYDNVANIQAAIATAALSRIEYHAFTNALDIGCGTGRHTQALTAVAHNVTGIDLAAGMLARARDNYPRLTFIQGDAEALPLQAAEYDLVFSSMALQWCRQPLNALSEVARCLLPGGRAELAIMVDGSFPELKQASANTDITLQLNPLFTSTDWLNTVQQTALVCTDAQCVSYADPFDSVLTLLRSIKGIGAGSATAATDGAGRQSLTRAHLKALEQAFKQHANGQLINSYQVLHLSLEKLA